MGRALLDFALDLLRKHGAIQAELTVTEGNQSAWSLYGSAGFADTGRREPLRDGSALQAIYLRVSL